MCVSRQVYSELLVGISRLLVGVAPNCVSVTLALNVTMLDVTAVTLSHAL